MNASAIDRAPRVTGLLLMALAVAAGCARPAAHSLTFERSVHLLAAGSPKAAIPVLSQVIASEPDGPEPHAMLALAYALDDRPDLAVKHAAEARRRRGRKDPPGWEGVAVGIAAMTRGAPAAAVERLAQVAAGAPAASALRACAQRWLALALLQKGDYDEALKVLAAPEQGNAFDGAPERATARLWAALTYAHQGRSNEAGEVLAEVAGAARGGRPPRPAVSTAEGPAAVGPESTPLDLALAGLDAVHGRNLARARSAFAELHARSPHAADALVWLALIDAAQGDWNRMRVELLSAAEEGPQAARGLARHLLSVVAALEGRPNDLIDHLLAGQRLLGRAHSRLPSPPPAQPERVWMSDRIR